MAELSAMQAFARAFAMVSTGGGYIPLTVHKAMLGSIPRPLNKHSISNQTLELLEFA